VNDGFSVSEALVKSLTKVDQTGKTETVIVHVLHLEELVVIGVIMLIVTLVLTAVRNLTLGSGGHRMTVVKAVAHLLVLLVLSYVILAAVWWYDARLVNTWFDVSRGLIGHVAAAIDRGGQLELVFRTLGLARHLVAGCLMLVLALGWEIMKWALRAPARLARS
jgi:nitrogen fixation/metabolism regulation signal transduction histidine kinase